MSNSDDCILCGAIIQDKPWNKYADLCIECSERAMARMSHEERKRIQWYEWRFLVDDIEDTVVPEMPESEWSDSCEWSWPDWIFHNYVVIDTVGTSTRGYVTEIRVTA